MLLTVSTLFVPQTLMFTVKMILLILSSALPRARLLPASTGHSTMMWSLRETFSSSTTPSTGLRSEIIFNKLTNIFFRSDAGEYLCHAANKHGEQTISVVVNVLHRPQCNILIFTQDSLQIFYFRFCQFQSGGGGDCVAVRGLSLS